MTQEDIDKGTAISNVPTVTAAQSATALDTATAAITFERRPAMTVAKSADKTGFSAAGEEIKYTVVVTNEGNVTLEDVAIADSLVPQMTALPVESGTKNGKLDVGETWTYTYTYKVKQSDVDAGFVKNSAKAFNPDIPNDPDAPSDELTITGTRTPSAKVTKTANPTTPITVANTVVNYTYVVENTGNVTP